MGRRAVVIVLDGLGAGKAPDAADFGDEGANTLTNTARATGGLRAPNLEALGLGNIEEIEGIAPSASPAASHGLMVELSAAKATLAGHWEMMGLVLEAPLPTYPEGFPDDVLRRFEKETTGAWILYTSADSVFQIAAHTGMIPLDELYEASKKAHKMLIGEGEIMVERVIARPFHGEPGSYEREPENRHDYGITPSSETYLDRIKDAGHETVAVGKIRDIFDGKGITRHLPAPPDDNAKVDAILDALENVESGLIFANLVDFDASYGHRRDPEGMAENIQHFDERLPELLDALTAEDLMIITADHGNDPTFRGTDHTRERAPLLVISSGEPHNLGIREGFSDVGASVAAWLRVEQGGLPGRSFV